MPNARVSTCADSPATIGKSALDATRSAVSFVPCVPNASGPLTNDSNDMLVMRLVHARSVGVTIGRVSNELAHPPHPVVLPAAPGWPIHPAMVTVAFELPSFRLLRSLGVVRGVSIRGNADSGADLAVLGDQAQTYSQRLASICEQARFQAHLLMLQSAAQVGANGVIGVCYETAPIHQSMFEVLAYGTAVWAEYIEDAPVFVAHAKAIEPPQGLARRDEGDRGR